MPPHKTHIRTQYAFLQKCFHIFMYYIWIKILFAYWLESRTSVTSKLTLNDEEWNRSEKKWTKKWVESKKMKKKKTKCRAQQQYIQLKSNERKKKIESNKTMEKMNYCWVTCVNAINSHLKYVIGKCCRCKSYTWATGNRVCIFA